VCWVESSILHPLLPHDKNYDYRVKLNPDELFHFVMALSGRLRKRVTTHLETVAIRRILQILLSTRLH